MGPRATLTFTEQLLRCVLACTLAGPSRWQVRIRASQASIVAASGISLGTPQAARKVNMAALSLVHWYSLLDACAFATEHARVHMHLHDDQAKQSAGAYPGQPGKQRGSVQHVAGHPAGCQEGKYGGPVIDTA